MIFLVGKLSAGNMDPYAILKCRSQEQRSSIASGGYSYQFTSFFEFLFNHSAYALLECDIFCTSLVVHCG